MKTEYVDLRDGKDIDEGLYKAAQIIKNGGLVAFPTETVYGLGANGLDENAVPKIYEAKGRPSDNPLILHISEFDEIKNIVKEIPNTAFVLADEFWPGPLTMVFKKSNIVPYRTTGGLESVAVRMPSNKIARELIKMAGVPVAAPSANSSGRPSPTKASHVMEDLAGKIDMVIDGGAVDIGIESTIVDMTGEVPIILRPGFITEEMLSEAIGRVEVDEAVKSLVQGLDFKPKAPGMKYRHYAPSGKMVIYKGDSKKVIELINEEIKKLIGKKTAVLATDETKDLYEADIVVSVGSRQNAENIAHNLFDVLRKFDEMGAEIIFSESFDENKLGFAIMNRLHKSAGYNIINV
ncbi:MAG: L-threonylcarbamoyladenylate synthase [Catonella sp.]|uniref:L-threonylcarbamoyladenylate synthase n=1 Tax=Catonella sp. TaxID=2382125 RepID=UPI003FA01278